MKLSVGFTYTVDQLGQAAAFVLENAGNSSVIAFYGNMGAGKTTLIRAICDRLGVKDEVSSPTFSLVNEYQAGGKPLYHFDFYRIRSEQEAFDMGYEDYFFSGSLCLVEWPEKIEALLPPGCLKVRIAILDDFTREVTI